MPRALDGEQSASRHRAGVQLRRDGYADKCEFDVLNRWRGEQKRPVRY